MNGPDRTISILKLFTLQKPAWSVEEAVGELGVSVSTVYRYVAALEEEGLLAAAGAGQYVLGPALIQYDWQIRQTDPLLHAAKQTMTDLAQYAPSESTVLLCRAFQNTVMCIHQVADPDRGSRVSYERGRPMPLFRGATSKMILAHLPARDLRRLYKTHQSDIAGAGLGKDWDAFRATLAGMRKAGHAITFGEVDPEQIGIAAPILNDQGRALGSISYVVSAHDDRATRRLASLVTSGAREIESNLRGP